MSQSDRAAEIATSLALLRDRIGRACAQAGRAADAVTLVAVSKTYPESDIAAALAAGQAVFGENRVQEAEAKFPALRAAHPGLRLHLIGTLQTNKARAAVALADVIESLDRPRLADALEDAAQLLGRLPELLIQVNTGAEAQKSGIGRDAADGFIAACQRRFGARLRGLMCIPPADADPTPHFTWLASAARRHGLAVLSMGMSADFPAAIACGATHVRVGTAVFGRRG